MLGRLFYILILLALILGGGFVLNVLVQGDGQLVLHYGDRIYTVTLFEAAILLAVLVIALMAAIWLLRLALALLRFIAGDEAAMGQFFTRARERQGLNALSQAHLALAVGDAKLATRKAQKAGAKLLRPELTRVINAQAAELAGDQETARKYYRALMMDPKTAFVGARGLMHLALKNDDRERALKLAERARELKPKDGETLETLYMLHSQAFDWGAARRTLEVQTRAGQLPAPEAHRRESALALAQAEDALNAGETEQARKLAVEAAKADPKNTNAVTTAARLLTEAGSKRQAVKLITNAWQAEPRPQLAASFAALEPDEAPAARLRRFGKIFAIHPDHAETKFLRAELALANRDWQGAQAAIGELRETEPSARSCAVMAAVARGKGEPERVVRAWLARALGAPRDEAGEVFISNSAMLPLLIESDEADADHAPTGDGPATHGTAGEETKDGQEAKAGSNEGAAPDPSPSDPSPSNPSRRDSKAGSAGASQQTG